MNIDDIFDAVHKLIGEEAARSLYADMDYVVLEDYAVDNKGVVYENLSDAYYPLQNLVASGSTPEEIAQSFLDIISTL